MWTDGIICYEGDCRVGDRAATADEVTAELARRSSLTVQAAPIANLKADLAALLQDPEARAALKAALA